MVASGCFSRNCRTSVNTLLSQPSDWKTGYLNTYTFSMVDFHFSCQWKKQQKKFFYCVESNRANAFLAHQAKLWCQTKTMSCIVPFTEPLTADIEFKWCVSVIVELYNFVQIRMFGAFHNLHLILKGQCGPVSACLGIPLLPAEPQCLPACQCLSVQQRQSCDCRIWFYCLQNAARYFIHFEWAFQTIRGQSFLPAVNM